MKTALLDRLERLEAQRAPPKAPPDVLADSFDQQRAFIADETTFSTAVCSRRAGKTTGCARKLVKAALNKPGSVNPYLTLTRINAKRILWSELLDLNRRLGLGGEPGEAELRVKFPNGSSIYLGGLNDRSEIEKLRGLPLGRVIIDEAQALPAYIENLVDEVLAPALMDYSGGIDLIGTPAPVPVGYFYDCTQSPEWSHHAWTVFDNPHILRKSGKTPQQHLEAELKRRGVTVDDPKIQREWFGRWVLDKNSLVFAYDSIRNHFDQLPQSKTPWEFCIGVDLGHDDADAIAVLAWSEDYPTVWLVDEWTGTKQTVTQLGDRLRQFEQKYQPRGIVADTGGLGKKIVVEITGRTGVPIEAAEKDRKLEHIELLNDALRSGRMFAKRDGRFAHDSMLVEWDRTNPEKPKISDRFHSDICDAVLYAYRKSTHWLHTPPPDEAPRPGTPDWLRLREEELERAAEERLIEERKQMGFDGGVGDSSNWEWWEGR